MPLREAATDAKWMSVSVQFWESLQRAIDHFLCRFLYEPSSQRFVLPDTINTIEQVQPVDTICRRMAAILRRNTAGAGPHTDPDGWRPSC